MTFTNGFHLRVAIVFGFIGVFFLASGVTSFQEHAPVGRSVVALIAGAAFFLAASWSATTLFRRYRKR